MVGVTAFRVFYVCCSIYLGGTVVEAKGDEMTRYSKSTVRDLRQECSHLSPLY